MSYSVYGKTYDEDGNILAGVKILPYFKKVDSESDPSVWSTEWYESDDNGYYSYSPEDSNLLGSEGSYKKTKDKFYVAYVYDEADKDSLTISRASFHEHTIPSADDKEINLAVETKRLPIVTAHSFPTAVLTQHEYTMSESSYADTDWVTLGQDENVSQKLIYDLVDIFDGHQVIDTLYRWDEVAERSVANSSSDSYTFVDAGVYNLGITAREKWNTEVVMSQEVTVKYNEPVMEFNWTPTQTNDWQGARIKGQETITFHNLSTSLDDRMVEPYRYKWTITDDNQDGSDNTAVHDSEEYGYEPTHEFQSIGTKTITLMCYWNDGFDDQTVEVVHTLEVYAFDIELEFSWDAEPKNRNQDVVFTPEMTGDTDKISQYDWVIADNYPAPDEDIYTFDSDETSVFGEGSSDNTQVVDNTYTFTDVENPTVKIHSVEPKNANVVVHYYNGWVTVTETIDRTITPVKYDVVPSIAIDDNAPQGRDVLVTHSNTSGTYEQDGFDLGYGIDWTLEDSYSECNLDNPTPGTVVDNSDSTTDVDKTETITHMYQSTDTHTVDLEIRYDDGYQMQTKRTSAVVNPIVYEGLVADFTWDKTPVDRLDTVTFTNTSTDVDNRFRSYSWEIQDKYNKWNPDSSDYGVDVVDNVQVITKDTTSTLEPTHNYQDESDELVTMTYWYDDGYCERSVDSTQTVTKGVHTITVDIANNVETVGKMEVEYTSVIAGSATRAIDEDWDWNDVQFSDGSDAITSRDSQVVGSAQPFTWQSPSRKPYCAVDGATAENKNKLVELEVRLDTGWRDDTDDATDNTDGIGGQVYWATSKLYEATPYEISSSIAVTDSNKLGYTH